MELGFANVSAVGRGTAVAKAVGFVGAAGIYAAIRDPDSPPRYICHLHHHYQFSVFKLRQCPLHYSYIRTLLPTSKWPPPLPSTVLSNPAWTPSSLPSYPITKVVAAARISQHEMIRTRPRLVPRNHPTMACRAALGANKS